MKKCVVVLALAALIAPVAAQQSTPQPQQPAQPQAPVDIATHLKRQHATIRRNIAASADKVSEADYAFKPAGVAAEVRNYGQFLVHLINANNSFCARAKGEAAKPSLDEKGTHTKADIVKALNDALTYCDGAYDSLTATSAVEMVKAQGRGGTTEFARMNPLVSNLGHNWEHYGNLVTYMRAKGIVPPSSEGR